MKIGIVGYQGAGKSTLFTWLTGIEADPSLSHTTQSAMATVPDARVEPLCQVYSPKKVTLAALEIVDTPGLSRTHAGNAAKLSQIREAGCLVQIIGAYAGGNSLADLKSLEEDFLIADLEIVTGRCERLQESIKKPRPDRAEQMAELAAIEPIKEHLETGQPIRDFVMSEEQIRFTRSFALLTQKPRMAIFNVGDDFADPASFEQASTEECPVFAVPVGLELELSRMTPAEQAAFREEMGISTFDRGKLIRTMMDVSGQQLFFTAGEKEVRTWMLAKGGTALDAADGIHSDLARGFIRAETMTCADLIRLGSERDVKAHNLMRQEPKDYVVQDGDILNIRFSV